MMPEIANVDAENSDREEAPIKHNSSIVEIGGVPSFAIETHEPGDDIYISRHIIEHGSWEPFETEITRRLLPAFDLFIDIGANIGWYTCIAQRIVGPSCAIHAFEPDPSNLLILRRNARAAGHSRTFVNGAALSDGVGRTSLYKSSNNLGDHRLYRSADERRAVVVPMTTLDVYFGDRSLPPRLVKMDTQGSEPRIFRGGARTLSHKDRDSVFIIEFWPFGMQNAGADIDAYIDHLANFTQRPFVIDQTVARLRPTSWQELKRRVGEDLAPATEAFVDVVMVSVGSAAYYTIDEMVAD